MTARSGAYPALQVPDMERRVADMIRIGTISHVDYSDPQAPRVRVKYGKNNYTGWLPWTAKRAGRARTWEPLKTGEQVIIASPSGDMAQGVVIGSINFKDRPAPSGSDSETVTEWDGGAREVFDDASNSYTLTVPAGGKITFKCGATTFELSNDGTKLTTPQFKVDSETSTFTGNVIVQKLLSFLGGLTGRNNSGGAVATMYGDINHQDGTLRSNGVGLHTHNHGGVQPGGSNTAQPNGGT